MGSKTRNHMRLTFYRDSEECEDGCTDMVGFDIEQWSGEKYETFYRMEWSLDGGADDYMEKLPRQWEDALRFFVDSANLRFQHENTLPILCSTIKRIRNMVKTVEGSPTGAGWGRWFAEIADDAELALANHEPTKEAHDAN